MDLQEHLLADPAAQKPDWRVTDASRADWALRKLGAVRRRMVENAAVAEAEIARVQHWLERQQAALSAEAAHWEALLAAWHRAVLAEDPARKTISLPNGRLKLRAQSPDLQYDPDALLATLRTTGRADLIRVREEINKAAVRGAVLKDGESLPGITVVEREAAFSVDVEEEVPHGQ